MKRRQSDADFHHSGMRGDNGSSNGASLYDIIKDTNNPRRDAAIHYIKDGLLFFNMICLQIRMAMESNHGLPDSFDEIVNNSITLVNNGRSSQEGGEEYNEHPTSNDALEFKRAADIYDTKWVEENNLGGIFGSGCSPAHNVIFGNE
jgi:hypothetical protein